MALLSSSAAPFLLLVFVAGEPMAASPKIDRDFLMDAKAPQKNKALLQYAVDQLGKKVGDGECATLAYQGLRTIKSDQPMSETGKPRWGKLVVELKPGSIQTGKVLPGDVLQMYDVRLEHKSPTGFFFQVAPFHTAIVTKVEPRVLHVLHQNWGGKEDARTVMPTTFRLVELQKGVIQVFRPQ